MGVWNLINFMLNTPHGRVPTWRIKQGTERAWNMNCTEYILNASAWNMV
jgi:hypothetical protein